MKRLISITLALILCLGFTLQSFAAVSLNENQIYVSGTGAYVFGSFDVNDAITEVGVKVNGKNYPADSLKSYQMMKNGKFGMGFNDPEALLGSSYDVTPYYVTASGEVTGEAVTVRREIINTVTDVTVGGKSVAGFYRGTSETDFYYGMDSLPETAAELPAVSVESGKTVLELETEVEYGGYVTTASLKGVEILRVHFREFVEITHTVRPEQFVSVYYNRASATDAMLDVPANTGSGFSTMYMGIETYGDETSEENKLLYAIYDVPAVEDYAPVYYELAGLRAKFTPFSIYNYDGDLTSKTFPITNDDEGNVNEFVHYEGLNTTDEAFKLVDIGSEIDSSNNVIDTEAVIASSPTVKEGKNILIYKASGDILEIDGADYQTRVDYIAYAPGKQMAITVKYVEKTPVDKSLTDTSLKSLRINGADAEGYDEENGIFYTGVESLDAFDFESVNVAAETNVSGATVEYGDFNDKIKELPITVTAKDGATTGEYKLVFKEIQHEKIYQSHLPYLYHNGTRYSSGHYNTQGYLLGRRDNEEWESANTTVTYAQFSTAALGNFAVSGKSYFNAIPERNTTYLLYNTTYETISNKNTFDEIKNGEADLLATLEVKAGDGLAGEPYRFEIESSLLKPKANGNIYIGLTVPAGAAVGFLKPVSATEVQNLELGYILLEPNADPDSNDVSIKSVKVNGDEAHYYDEASKTFYYGIDSFGTFDFDNCEIVVTPTVSGAEGFGFADSTTRTAEIEVTSKDGTVTEEYTLIFRELKKTTITPATGTMLEYVPASGIYQTGSRDLVSAGTLSTTPSDGILGSTDRTRITYIPFNAGALGKFVLVGNATMSITPTRYDTYVFFDSEYDVITKACRFTEVTEGTAPILGSYICANSSDTDITVNAANNVEIDSSLLRIKESGNIVIGVYDGNPASGSCIIKNPSLTFRYLDFN